MPAKDLIVDLAVRYGFQVLGAIVILIVGFIGAWWTGKLVDRPLQRLALEPPMRWLMVRTVRIVVLLFALVIALDKFGFQIAPLVAGLCAVASVAFITPAIHALRAAGTTASGRFGLLHGVSSGLLVLEMILLAVAVLRAPQS